MSSSSLLIFLSAIYILGGLAAVVGSTILDLNKQHIGIAFAAAGVIGLMMSSSGASASQLVTRTPSVHRYLAVGAFLLLAVAAIAARESQRAERLSSIFFGTVTGAVTLIAIQIMWMHGRQYRQSITILSQIVLLGAVLVTAYASLYPSGSGNDSYFHVVNAEQMRHAIEVSSDLGQYASHPGYHLLLAMFAEAGLGTILSAHLALALLSISAIVLLYIVLRGLLEERPALLAALLGVVGTHLLVARSTFYPSAAVIALYAVGFVHICLESSERGGAQRATVAVLLFTAALLSHPISPIYVLIFVSITLVGARVAGSSESPISGWLVAALCVMTVGWWMYAARTTSIFDAIVLTLRRSPDDEIGSATESGNLAYVDVFLNDFGMTALLFLSAVGAFLLFRRHNGGEHRRARLEAYAVSVLLLLPIPFVQGGLSPNSIPARWFPLIELLAVSTAGLTLVRIAKAGRPTATILTVSTVTLITFAFLTSPVVNQNSELYATALVTRSGLNDAEVAGRDWHDEVGLFPVTAGAKYAGISDDYLDPADPATYGGRFVAIREFDRVQGVVVPQFGTGGDLVKVVSIDAEFLGRLAESDHIYTNGVVDYYWVRP